MKVLRKVALIRYIVLLLTFCVKGSSQSLPPVTKRSLFLLDDSVFVRPVLDVLDGVFHISLVWRFFCNEAPFKEESWVFHHLERNKYIDTSKARISIPHPVPGTEESDVAVGRQENMETEDCIQ